jgi:hypothetical protein
MQYPFPGWFERNYNAVINGINRIHSNVWMVIIIGLGAWLMAHDQVGSGTALLTGSFAILKSNSDQAGQAKTTTVQAKGGEAIATEQTAVE